jgi:large subunit ribosomal protein L14e
MAVIETGQICIKTHGREKGRKCIVVERIDKNFVLITGPKEITGVRRRRTNVDHISPTKKEISIKPGAEDKDIVKVLESADMKAFMQEKPKT